MRKHETQNTKHETRVHSGSARLKLGAIFTLLGVLLILCLRLTMTEALRQSLLQKAAWLGAIATGKADDFPRFIGPDVIAVFAAATALLAGVATICAVLTRALTVSRVAKLGVLAAVIALAVISAFHAANRYLALVGTVDLAMALLAGSTVSILCQQRVLGDKGRRVVIAALIGILAAWTLKGLHQRFVEFPDTIAEYQKNREERLREAGIRLSDEYAKKLFESRILAQEVSGFLSLSNVNAAGLIGLIATLAGVLTVGVHTLACAPRPPPVDPEPRKKFRQSPERKSDEISLAAIVAGLAAVLLIASLVAAYYTGSRGGFALSCACVILIGAAVYFRNQVMAWRRTIVVAVLATALLGAAGIVTYGLRHDALPSKSLTFRWHYWTASATLIKQQPLTGVGLHNFGDYYVAVKRPGTPEDVSDPHSFFVRIAAEIGIPAAILIGGLILWQILHATRRTLPETPASPPPPPPPLAVGWRVFAGALVFSAAWWIAHFFLADSPYIYNVYFVVIFALLSAAAAWAALVLMHGLSPAAMRAIVLAALAGAFAMLVYDQINMALVTGPVAMLFWMMIGVADSYDAPPAAGPRANIAGWPIAALCAAGAVLPLLIDRLDANSAPYEFRYIEKSQPGGDSAEALAAIDNAIARAPRSIELRTQRILIKQRLHLPVADEIRQVLELDRANARPRIMFAKPESDLPAAERAKILEDALRLDRELPDDEPKRLPPPERADIQQLIDKLTTAK